MRIGEHVVEAVFQPYHSSVDPSLRSGELLTRPEYPGLIEEFFGGLDVDRQFELLEWHLSLQRALRSAGDWHTSINVNNTLLAQETQRDRFLDLVAGAGGPITFEFTETHPMPPIEASNHLLRSLRELGHKSALDDFGSGLNGMSLLTDYDFDVIKIDNSLIADLPHRVEKRQTIGLVREMLSVLDKQHVVEGVETEDVYEVLLELGFTVFQGYLFARPQPLSEFGVIVEEVQP